MEAVRTFGKVIRRLDPPNLTDNQRTRYEDFLQVDIPPTSRADQGLEKMLRTEFPIVNEDGNKRISYIEYRIHPSVYTPEECRHLKQTYQSSIDIRLQREITNPESGQDVELQEEYIPICEIPLMIGGGEFIINGTERVFVSQIKKRSEEEGRIDNTENLDNRRVESVIDRIARKLSRVIRDLADVMRKSISDNDTAPKNKPFRKLEAAKLFSKNELSQVVDQINPLAQLVHERRISALGHGGINKNASVLGVRDVHPSHYGRLCPVETPEGGNIGLVLSLATFSSVNPNGYIHTPYYVVKNRKITDEVVYLTASEERDHYIGQAGIKADSKGDIVPGQYYCRHGEAFMMCVASKISLLDVAPSQLVGVSASLIPFIEHNDASRALMGCNMQRQAIPLIRPDVPLVATGVEADVARNTNMVERAKEAGIVTYADALEIRVSSREVPESERNYPLHKFKRLNGGTTLNQTPLVRTGDIVNEGDILTEGAATRSGQLALGKNVRVAFMSWRGYNFEDSIIVSEELVCDDAFTSVHIHEYAVAIWKSNGKREEITRDIPGVPEVALSALDENGIVTIGTHVKPGDILVGKVSPIKKSELTDEDEIQKVLFGSAGEEVKNDSLLCPPGTEGCVIDVKRFTRRDPSKAKKRKAQELEIDRIQAETNEGIVEEIKMKLLRLKTLLGDAPVNRRTGKVLRVLKDKDYEWFIKLDKQAQAYELDLPASKRKQGLAICLEHDRRIAFLESRQEVQVGRLKRGDELPKNMLDLVKVYVAVKRKLSVGDKMAGRHGNKGVVSRILPVEDMPYLEDGTPIQVLLNPLGIPSRMNVGQVMEVHIGWAAKELGIHVQTPIFDGATENEVVGMLKEAGLPEDGKTGLFDGQTGEPFDERVTVGYMYIMKLNHLAADKIHARETGPYESVTEQPTKGKARNGGQRVGEMEVWAMEAHGASAILQEMIRFKSDDIRGRKSLKESLKSDNYDIEAGSLGGLDLLSYELRGLGVAFETKQIESPSSTDLDFYRRKQSASLRVPSEEERGKWSNGEVKHPRTINNDFPVKDGLCCEQIFGSGWKNVCECGNNLKPDKDARSKYCPACKKTFPDLTRIRMGHISLPFPVVHPWYYLGNGSLLTRLLGISAKDIREIVHFERYVVTDPGRSSLKYKEILSPEMHLDETKRSRFSEHFRILNPNKRNDFSDVCPGDVLISLKEYREALIAKNQKVEVRKVYNGRYLLIEHSMVVDKKSILSPTFQGMFKLLGKKVQSVDCVSIGQTYISKNKNLEEIRDSCRLKKFDISKQTISRSICIRIKDINDRNVTLLVSTKWHCGDFKAEQGARAIHILLEHFDSDNARDKNFKLRRMFKRREVEDRICCGSGFASRLILQTIPVIPSAFRPLHTLDSGKKSDGDMNRLYINVLKAASKAKESNSIPDRKDLQLAVNALFDNKRSKGAVVAINNLKSLTGRLEGKEGRFRSNLLGKRVDYSARAVIVVNPTMKIDVIGLPMKIVLTLFKPYLARSLIKNKKADTYKKAIRMLEDFVKIHNDDARQWSRDEKAILSVIPDVLEGHPVLLNRAPTLHRMSVQAFYPKLVKGDAVQLHPLVCTGFNADFDGDQMAVHLPLTVEAQTEAAMLMLPSVNLFSPAHGKPILSPTLDIVLGCYYLTLPREKERDESIVFRDFQEVLFASDHKKIGLGTIIKVRLPESLMERDANGKPVLDEKGNPTYRVEVEAGKRDILVLENGLLPTTAGRVLFNDILPCGMKFYNLTMNKKNLSQLVSDCHRSLGRAATVQLLDSIKDIGFLYATLSGLSFSVADLVTPPNKDEHIKDANAKVTAIEGANQRKDSSDIEILHIWEDATQKITDDLVEVLKTDTTRFGKPCLNPVWAMFDSGARGAEAQLRQLCGIRGLMTKPNGQVLETPILANLREGLHGLEYFLSTHGARKGLADSSLKTADAGELTRNLVFAAQGVTIRSCDCGTQKGVSKGAVTRGEKVKMADNIFGRVSAACIRNPTTNEVIVEAGELITRERAHRIEQLGLETVLVRSPLTCELDFGICAKCYGMDLSTQKIVEPGLAVGVIAAQSIGEPGTQLTMRTFHRGGVAEGSQKGTEPGEAQDITGGVPRLKQLFGASTPKDQCVMVKVDGVVEIAGLCRKKRVIHIHIKDDKGDIHEHSVPEDKTIRVKSGDRVRAGDFLIDGTPNPHDILQIQGQEGLQKYLLDEIQSVFRSQEVRIDDKHVEIVIRQMLKKVKVTDPGDTDFLVSDEVTKEMFRKVNAGIMAQGKSPAKSEPILQGISKVGLDSESVLAAAGFREAKRVLAEAALSGRTDPLRGLSENVIVGQVIPAGTGAPDLAGAKIHYAEGAAPPSSEKMADAQDIGHSPGEGQEGSVFQ